MPGTYGRSDRDTTAQGARRGKPSLVAPYESVRGARSRTRRLRWGELVALRPCDIDFSGRTVIVRRVVVDVAKKNSPTGERCFIKDYPKDDEQRTVSIDKARASCCASTCSTIWGPAVRKAKVEQKVTFHNLRAAHASWLLAS